MIVKAAFFRRVAREPLVQFMAIGLATWLLVSGFDEDRARYIIEIGPKQVEQLAAGYEQQFGAPPTQAQLKSLIDRYIKEEIAWREGIAMQLDRDDEIVRRRVIQKFAFLQADQSIPAKPSDSSLAHWYRTHQSRYRIPSRVSFAQIYFSPDLGGSEAARGRAETALLRLSARPQAPELGDAFPGPTDDADLNSDEVIRIFGRSPIVDALFNVPLNRWMGPFRSGYGWHLVRVIERKSPAIPPLSEVHDQVRSDYLDTIRETKDRLAYAKLRARYTVRVRAGAP